MQVWDFRGNQFVRFFLTLEPILLLPFIYSHLILRSICIQLSLLLFTYQVTEISLGMLKCIEISYYGYLFATIKDKKHYQMATGCAMAGVMSGMCVSGLLGQLIVYNNNRDYSVLIYYSLAGIVEKYINIPCNHAYFPL